MTNYLLGIFIGIAIGVSCTALFTMVNTSLDEKEAESKCIASYISSGIERSAIHASNGTCRLK